MTDTQWPLYEVFIQEKPNKSHHNVGSVHAVDGEMAVLNARTVFGRRPLCHNMWVAPRTAILSRTAEELTNEPLSLSSLSPDDGQQAYYIFQKTTQRRAMAFVVHVGEVTAVSPEQALQAAIDIYSDKPVYVWWVIPTDAINKTEDDDLDAFFAPALDKTYRQPSAYRTFSAIRRARKQKRPS
ncbi:MAG: phenylacetic acid degradation protein [Chloroflexota bacterium]